MTRRREFFEPYGKGDVTIYLCGPTLNGFCHLGHVKTYVFFDVMARYFRYKGYKVRFVTNLTDFDNDIIARSKEIDEHPLVFSGMFEQAFFEDMKVFGLRSVNNFPRASDHVQDMIEIIKGLMKKGIAYESDGVVFFDAKRFQGYRTLFHGRNLRLLCRVASVLVFGFFSIVPSVYPAAVEAVQKFSLTKWLLAFLQCWGTYDGVKKRDPYDFPLWMCVDMDELGYESPWGRGRPGWHIECSAMSMKYLGPQLVIHGGGEELKLHHESENAISESYTAKRPFVRYWIHTGRLTLKGRKMAKSVGNVITIREFLKKHSADSLRLLVLSRHYPQRIDFSDDELMQCEEIVKTMYETRDGLSNLIWNLDDRESKMEEERKLLEEIARTKMEFLMGMDSDFNTAIALASFYQLIQLGKRILNIETSKNLVKTAFNTINELGDVLGLFQEVENPRVSVEVGLPSLASARRELIAI